MFRSLVLKSSALPFLKHAVTQKSLFKPVVERFIAGETVDQALEVARSLVAEGYNVSLDMLGENVASEEEATAETKAYCDLAKRVGSEFKHDRVNVSVKMTALGLDQGDAFAEANYRKLLTAAGPHLFVRCDMEGSAYTQRTIDLVKRVYKVHKNTGTVLQSYLYRTDRDLDALISQGMRLRLVKGAYLEPATVAYQEKAEVDERYLALAKKMMIKARYPALATHDAKIIKQLKEFATRQSIPKDHFEWQMLYGIRRDLQKSLLAEGYRVRVYIPFGKAWYPYFSRRLAERPANLMFIAKAMMGR